MRRLLFIGLACVIAAGVVAPAAPARTPRASTAVDACHVALHSTERYAVFSGTMRSLRRGTDRMYMRFDLFQRSKGTAAFKHVLAPGLGVWNPADRGVRRFRFRQKVTNLSAPAGYRAVVSFRWTEAEGRPVLKTSHLTPVCFQRDLRPDLRIGRVTGSRLPNEGALYQVTVRNDGGVAATGFDVGLDVDGTPVLPRQALATLAPGARQVVTFRGPRCAAGGTLLATADPDNRVDEADETNDALTVPCPLG
jgi:hypothetical protein